MRLLALFDGHSGFDVSRFCANNASAIFGMDEDSHYYSHQMGNLFFSLSFIHPVEISLRVKKEASTVQLIHSLTSVVCLLMSASTWVLTALYRRVVVKSRSTSCPAPPPGLYRGVIGVSVDHIVDPMSSGSKKSTGPSLFLHVLSRAVDKCSLMRC